MAGRRTTVAALRKPRIIGRLHRRTPSDRGLQLAWQAAQAAYEKSGGMTPALRDLVLHRRTRVACTDAD
jgi:hypothetical protein